MRRKLDNKGVTLIELIVVISIMVALVGVVAPMMVGYVDKAKQVRVEKEASEFLRAAQVAYVDVYAQGKQPGSDAIKNRASASSPYYRNGTKYGNLTNWTVHNGTVAGASNGAFAESFFSFLGIKMGAGWKNGSKTVPISSSQPKMNPAGSLTDECIFQIFYTAEGDVVVEYSRSGYFVRMENGMMIDSLKVKNNTEKVFTTWQ